METNQTDCVRLEQISIINLLMVEKYKLCEMYIRMTHVLGEACLSKIKCSQMGQSWICHCEFESKRQSIE